MNEINNIDGETLHALHRAMANHRKAQQLHWNEMAIQKAKGLAAVAFSLLMLKVGGAEYALAAFPLMAVGVWMVATRRNFEHAERAAVGARYAGREARME